MTPAQDKTNSPPPHATEGEKVARDLESAFGEAETGVRNDPHKIAQRTKGLWIFDNVLFNATNLAVFGLSVYATYKTNYSQPQGTPRELQNWLMKRGTSFTNALTKRGMSEESAKNANMVLWSFIDGTLAAPIVAVIEHRRNQIGRWIDDRLGTTPEDKSIYENQPKEGWKSVILGRLAAFSIVMPTYFALDHKFGKNSPTSLNNVLFDRTAEAIVKHNFTGIPKALKNHFPKLNVEGLVKTSVFETFYTTLCTSILFAASFLIGKHDRQKNPIVHSAEELQGGEKPEATNGSARSSWQKSVGKKQEDSHTATLAKRGASNSCPVPG